jgi:hypothetical protein
METIEAQLKYSPPKSLKRPEQETEVSKAPAGAPSSLSKLRLQIITIMPILQPRDP